MNCEDGRVVHDGAEDCCVELWDPRALEMGVKFRCCMLSRSICFVIMILEIKLQWGRVCLIFSRRL